MYSPFHSKVQEDMHTSSSLSILPFTLYVYGLAFGPAVAAPLSETFGRRSVYIMATPVAMLFILGAGFSRSISSLAVCRLLAGIAISAPLAVGAGTILDMWSSLNANRAIILLMTTAFLGPALGSLAGGWISQYKDWPWSQWTSLFLGAATWIFALGAKESYAAPLIRRRAIRHNLPIPPSTKPTGWRGLRFMATVTLARPVMMLVKDPVVLLCSLYSSLNFSILFSFLASIPLVYGTVYDFSPGQSGLVFISITIGSALGGLALIFLDAHTFKLYGRHCKSEPSPPERMLWGAMIGGPLMAVALFWFAWTSQPQFHWVISILATGLFGFSNILIFVGTLDFLCILSIGVNADVSKVSTMLYLTNLYGAQYGASALAANGLLRYIIGGSFPLFTETS